MDGLVTVTAKNQITIPAFVAKLLGVKKGDKFWVKAEADQKTISFKKADTWDDLQGIFADHPLTKKYTTLEIIEIARKREGRRLAKKYGL